MSLQDHPRAYGVVALTVAFAGGVLVTLGLKDLYPDLELRYQDSQTRKRLRRAVRRQQSKRSSSGVGESWSTWLGRLNAASSSSTTTTTTTAQAAAASRRHLRRESSAATEPGVQLEDHESDEVDEEDLWSRDDWSLLGESSVLAGSHHAAGAAAAGDHIANTIAGCIGDTPLVRIRSLSEATGCEVLAKAEFLNPGGSPKDRVALNIIRTAEAEGRLVPHRGDTIYEGTSGSTGISIATLARALGYRAHIFMPDDQAMEKTNLLREMGAVVERVPVAPIVDPGHYVNLARSRAAEHAPTHADGSRGFFADQFETPANAEAHRRGTGPEILQQVGLGSKKRQQQQQQQQQSSQQGLSAFVCGAGTAGTLTGVARFLKEDAGLRTLRVVAADPQGSGLFNLVRNGVLYAATEKEGTRRRSQVDSIVEGIGMNRMTATLEAGLHLIDDAVAVTDTQACRMARWLVEHDGIFAGSSTAVNCVAAVATALKLPPGSRVVTVLCDTGLRHMSKFYRIVDDMEKTAEDHKSDDDLLALLELPPRPTTA